MRGNDGGPEYRAPRPRLTDMSIEIHPALAALHPDPERFLEHDYFWAVVLVAPGEYYAAWIDEEGVRHTRPYQTRGRASRRARESWGR